MMDVKSLLHLCPIELTGKSDVKLYFHISILPPLQLFSLMINLSCQLKMYQGYIVSQVYGHFLLPPYVYSLQENTP